MSQMQNTENDIIGVTGIFYDAIRAWAAQTPDAPALLSDDAAVLSYAALAANIEEIGEALNACGFGRRDRIAIVHTGGADLAAAILSIWTHATAVPLNPQLRESEYVSYLRSLRVDAVAIEADIECAIRPAAAQLNCPVLTLVRSPDAPAGAIRLTGPKMQRTPDTGRAARDDVALVLMTSGTTATPKIVPIRHSHVMHRAEDGLRLLRLGPTDRGANLMQLYHWGGVGAGLNYPLYAGGSVSHFPGTDLADTLSAMERLEPTYIAGPYTIFQSILRQQDNLRNSIERIRPRIRMLRTGAGHLDPRLADALETLFDAPVIQAYGSSETAFMACTPFPPQRRKSGSVGLPGGSEIAIVDGAGRPVPANTEGEIAVQGAKVFEGYENDADVNDEAFRDGWFRTGDQGYLDADGYLFLTGRLKEIINRGGEKITPGEVDAAIMSHPAVAAAAAFPVPHPTLGDDVAAAVVPTLGATLDPEGLTDFLRQKLAAPKIPRRILFVDDIPKGDTGKIQRHRLAAAFGLDRCDAPAAPDRRGAITTPTEATLQRIWAETLQRPTVPLDEDFFALGGDSMMAVELFLRIEEQLGRRLPRAILLECGTVAAMATAIDHEYRAACLVPIQRAGDKPAFFCVHGIDGDVLYFRDLARHLGADQPFYGIRARGLDGAAPPSTSIPEMADRYVAEIRRQQPHGPYYIGGYSFGGWVAFEAARRLRDVGQTVALLAILDTKCIDGKPTRPLLARLQQADDAAQPRSGNRLFANDAAQTVANHLRLNAMAVCCRIGVIRKALEARFRRHPIEAHSVALRQYRPGFCGGDAVLVHAQGPGTRSPEQYAGWKKLIGGSLETRPIGGGHYDMMYEPAVKALADALADSIAAARRST